MGLDGRVRTWPHSLSAFSASTLEKPISTSCLLGSGLGLGVGLGFVVGV